MEIEVRGHKGDLEYVKVVDVVKITRLPANTEYVDHASLSKEDIDSWIEDNPGSERPERLNGVVNIYPALYHGIFKVSAVPRDKLVEAIGYLKTEWGSVQWKEQDFVFLTNYTSYIQTCHHIGEAPRQYKEYVYACVHDHHMFESFTTF